MGDPIFILECINIGRGLARREQCGGREADCDQDHAAHPLHQQTIHGFA